jgi:hypothetical protein
MNKPQKPTLKTSNRAELPPREARGSTHPTGELCGIELQTDNDLRCFQRVNPWSCDTTLLASGPYRILVFKCSNFPTRGVEEVFDHSGKHCATFIGPDALEYTYQIKLGAPGEAEGCRPEAFQ